MRKGRLARVLCRFLIGLAILSAFVVLDWYPTFKELGRLRYEQNDLRRKIKDHGALFARFAFPDAQERSLLANSDADLLRALPQVESDAAWAAIVLAALQDRAGKDGISGVRVWITPQAPASELNAASPGRSCLLAEWIFHRQARPLADALSVAADPERFPWHGIISGLELRRGQQLANHPLGVAAMAPLPALLNFINHISWGHARLEIVRLRLEPGLPFSRAWLVCRGSYLSGDPSRWALPEGAGSGAGLLVDPDSPLLGQRIVPEAAVRGERIELAPLGQGE